MDAGQVIASAKRSIRLQSESVAALTDLITSDFVSVIQHVHSSTGRLVVSGIGKSAIIAQKIVATLNSTGTPALFMHAADAIHGDLGMIQQNDTILLISKSGESPEIKILIPFIKGFGNKIIGMTGHAGSYLGTQCDYLLNTEVKQEACPNNLAPTTSTTAQMVMGDALAICLMEMRGFGSQDFARYHPGGHLGKKLYLKVDDLLKGQQTKTLTKEAGISEVIVAITANRLGAVVILNDSKNIEGVVTDGDLRRMLEKGMAMDKLKAGEIMTVNPKQISSAALAAEALELMRQYHINQLVVSDEGKYLGIVHIQDIMREGIF
jgi:arabinose-5-phosphate isomerase